MPMSRVTPSKGIRARSLVIGRTDRFYDLRPEQNTDLAVFLEQFRRTWLSVRQHGVSGYAAILRLVHVLPASWQGWASTQSLDYIDYTREPEESGDFLGFHALVLAQHRDYPGPPPGEYPPLQHYQPFIHQLFREHRERRVDPPPQPAEDVPPVDVSAQNHDEPMMIDSTHVVPVAVEPIDPPPLVETDDDFEIDDDYVQPELDPFFADAFLSAGIPLHNQEFTIPTIDLDLHDQPFSLPSPTLSADLDDSVDSQIDFTTFGSEIVPGSYPVHTVPRDSIPPITPEPSLILIDYPRHLLEVHLFQEPTPPADDEAGSSRPPGLSRSYLYEPEMLKTVGKGKA